jgi:DNA-binding MarR family transcriptional regulator
MERDSVDLHVERWLPELPDLDPRVEAIVTRMYYIVRYLRRDRERLLKELGLQLWEWELLHALRFAGEPYRVTPTTLADQTGVPATTMTSRLGRLEERGFVRRVHDPDDRRRLLVELTRDGHATWDETMDGLDRTEKELFASMKADDQELLADLLRPLMLHVDAQI